VMELIEGVTLRRWLEDAPRGRAEILGVFAQAARGLAAAHGAGIVHRDFKPDNVLVGNDGRVRVADFGLARVLDAGTPTPVPAAPAPLDETLPAPQLMTQTGALVGTPAYMAPEQWAREKLDARADQFAFAVTLHEALYGVRPFAGETYAQLGRAVRDGKLREPPADRDVPAWLRAILLRALARDPAGRFPDMAALVAALSADPAVTRARRWRILGVAALVGVALGALGLAAFHRRDEPALCESAGAELAAVWNPAASARLEKAFVATGRPYAADTFTRVARRFDQYGDAWASMRREACEATHVRGTQSDGTLDLRMRCLDRRLAELGALVTVLGGVDSEVLSRATNLASDLAPVSACADVEALAAVVPPPADPVLRARGDALRGRLEAARARARALRFDEGLGMLGPVVEEARSLAYPGLLGETLYVRSQLEAGLDRWPQAEATLREALVMAAEAHDDTLVAAVMLDLVDVVAHLQVRLAEGKTMRPFVEAALRRAGVSAAVRADCATTLGNIAILGSDLGEARVEYERALALRERALPADHPLIAASLQNLGYVLRQSGVYPEAQRYLERALALQEKVLGPEHPSVALSESTLGILLIDRADYPQAKRLLLESLRLYDSALGPSHPDSALTMTSLGGLEITLGELEAAREHLRRALLLREQSRGTDHPSVAQVLNHLGRLALEEGRLDDAQAYLERAVALHEKAFGPDHPQTARSLGYLAAVHEARGDSARAAALWRRDLAAVERALGASHRDAAIALAGLGKAVGGEEGRADLERALIITERLFGPEHPDLAPALGALAALSRPPRSIELLERALRIRERAGVAGSAIAESRFALARALWDSGGDRVRAVALARNAREVARSPGEIDRWLAARSAPASAR